MKVVAGFSTMQRIVFITSGTSRRSERRRTASLVILPVSQEFGIQKPGLISFHNRLLTCAFAGIFVAGEIDAIESMNVSASIRTSRKSEIRREIKQKTCSDLMATDIFLVRTLSL